MIGRNTISSIILAICVCIAALSGTTTDAFTPSSIQSRTQRTASSTTTSLNQFGKKKPQDDLSSIESRDLTREEMLAINKRNEEVMNNELQAMTGVSVLFSLPILYLCYVAFF